MRVMNPDRYPRIARLFKFGAVGATGILVNQIALWAGAEALSIYYVWAAIIATQVSSAWNFILTERFVFPSQPAGRGRRLGWFTLMNNGWMVARLPMLWALTEVLGVHYLWSNLIAIASATLFRFFVADRWIWASPAPQDQAVAEVLDPRHYYDIHGIVGVASDRRLPELESFKVTELATDPDVDVIVTGEGFRSIRSKVVIEGEAGSLSYLEKPRGWGFGMRVDLGPPIVVKVSRLVGRSPHVLYTNVVEPLLRWLLVTKGYALVHGACLSINGSGVLITAQTDTGKTTTCLKTVNEHGSSFLSDDMVIVSPDGMALAYPKPLTISAHTMEAVRKSPLPFRQKLWLQIQSRLHSRTGRRFGMIIAALRLPVATLNALTQIVVPPPKFFIEQLLPEAQLEKSLKLTHMVVIERGEALLESLDHKRASEILGANTEDAYGFPPYPLLEEALSAEGGFCEALIHRSFLKRMKSMRLRTPDRNWYAQLPHLVSNGHNGNGNGYADPIRLNGYGSGTADRTIDLTEPVRQEANSAAV